MKKVVFLPYDFDTAIGINNEGSLAFGYSLEDTDQVGGEDVFNGQQSVLWRNLRDAYPAEIKALYQQLRSEGKLSYEVVEQMFEDHQAKWPEAVFNEDAKFKYTDPLEEDEDSTYLPMLQGSKAEQRKWWLYNRFRYMDSKYNSGDALTDYIQLRGYAKGDISVTPYADIYPAIKYGSYLVQTRGQRNQTYILECPLDNLNDTEIYIYSASLLASIGDISPLKVGLADFSRAVKLQDIKIGDSDSSYSNPNLKSVTFGNNKLLKTIDIRNCVGLGLDSQKSLDLSLCTGLEEVYLDGTSLHGVDFVNGGILKKVHLPGTITNLTLRNQTKITEFECPDYSNITTLWLDNPSSVIDTAEIVSEMPEGGRIRIFNFHWDLADLDATSALFDKLDTMRGLDQNGNNVDTPQVYGTIHVTNARYSDIASIQGRYPDVTITYDNITTTMTFMNFEGDTVIAMEIISNGGSATNRTPPARTNSDQYIFGEAKGWSLTPFSSSAVPNVLFNVTEDRTVYAAYEYTPVIYTATFKLPSEDGGDTLYIQRTVMGGQTPVYRGETPTTTRDYYVFDTWTPEIGPIYENTVYTAVFKDSSSDLIRYLSGSLTDYTNTTVSEIGWHAFYDFDNLETVSSQASVVGAYAFYGAENLITVDMPNLIKIDANAFGYCRNLTTINIPKLENIGSYAFKYCENLLTAYFPNLKNIGNYAFQNSYIQGTLRAPVENVGYMAFYNSDFEAIDFTLEFGRISLIKIIQQENNSIKNIYIRTCGPIYSSGYSYDPTNCFGTLPTDTIIHRHAAFIDSALTSGYNVQSLQDTITDSWTEIESKIENSTANYNVGDYKTIDLGNELGKIEVVIIGIDKDELADDSGYAKYTFFARILPDVSISMNNIDSSLGGIMNMPGQTYLQETIYPALPEELRNIIVPVKKYTRTYNENSELIRNDITTQSIFFLSRYEIYGNPEVEEGESLGPTYTEYFGEPSDFSQNKNRRSVCTNQDRYGTMWLRTAYSNSQFLSLSSSFNGKFYYNYPSSNGYPSFGFCIGRSGGDL